MDFQEDWFENEDEFDFDEEEMYTEEDEYAIPFQDSEDDWYDDMPIIQPLEWDEDY